MKRNGMCEVSAAGEEFRCSEEACFKLKLGEVSWLLCENHAEPMRRVLEAEFRWMDEEHARGGDVRSATFKQEMNDKTAALMRSLLGGAQS